MATSKDIHEFAIRWFEKYRSSSTKEHEVVEGFEDECSALGFEMDCNKSFETEFPDTNAFNDYEALDKIIEQVQDASLLGSAILSKWRYIAHCSFGEQLLSPQNRPWFIIAFGRLVALTSEDGTNPFIFEGEVQKIQITSNNISYGPFPGPDEEVEQRITINAGGRVWFSGYNYGQGFEQYERGRTKNYSIGKEAAALILNAVGTYFSDEYDTIFATDIGSWEMTITNTEGKLFKFQGSLCCDFEVDGVDLSDLIRETLGMSDLYVFDGNCKPDRVDKITINYHRVTKIKPKEPINETDEYVAWNYKESLMIDRKTETIEHTQNIGSWCVISRKLQVQGGVEALLDDLDAENLFRSIEGNPPDVIETPNETKDYEIVIDFERGSQRTIKGTFDKKGLPEDWAEFAEYVLEFILFYGLGEIFDPSTYKKTRRREGDYIYCSVTLNEGYKTYYYLTEDDSIEVGDYVLVPAGNGDRTTIAEIVNIEYFSEDEVPFPLDRVKSIIGKYAKDEYNPPVIDSETPNNDGMYSDNWLKQGYTSGSGIKVSDIVNYRVWTNNAGEVAGITVDFETANDFHYELLTDDWHRFLFEVLCITDISLCAIAFQRFLESNSDLFAFEEAMNKHGIKYRKITMV